MDYEEWQCGEWLAMSGHKWLRTGSRETCNPSPMDTDADFVVLGALDHALEKEGWAHTSESEHYGEGEFATWRKGECNLIVVYDAMTFRRWEVATAAAKQMNLKDKEARIRLFQGVLYGNWY